MYQAMHQRHQHALPPQSSTKGSLHYAEERLLLLTTVSGHLQVVHVHCSDGHGLDCPRLYVNAAALAAIVTGWLLERVVQQQPATCTSEWAVSQKPSGGEEGRGGRCWRHELQRCLGKHGSVELESCSIVGGRQMQQDRCSDWGLTERRMLHTQPDI